MFARGHRDSHGRLPLTLDPTAELDPWGQRIVDDLLFEGLTRKLFLNPMKKQTEDYITGRFG